MTDTRVDGRRTRYQHRKPELLAAATEYALEIGVKDLSLRPLAQALGITHASLLRHFTSKDELIMQIVDKIRNNLDDRVAKDENVRAATTVAGRCRAIWRLLCEPKEQRQFLLLFELVGHRGRDLNRNHDLAKSIVQDWTVGNTRALIEEGWDTEDAAAAATLLLAQVRGLQLDLLLTGERDRIDRALEISLRALEAPMPPSGNLQAGG